MEYCDDCKKATQWVEEDLGADSIKVCSECGKSKENAAYEVNCDEQSSSGLGSQLVHDDEEINIHGKIFAPRSSQRHRSMHFIRCIKEIASKMNLSKASTDRCVSCGKMILKENYDLAKKTMKVAAAVVFLDQQSSTPPLLMKDFSKKIGMKLTQFGSEVVRMKSQFGSMFSQAPNPEECLKGVVDELCLKMKVTDKRNEIFMWASQVREVTADCTYRKNRLSDVSKLNLSAYFALALLLVDPELSEKEIREEIGEIMGYAVSSLTHRMYAVRKRLFALANTLPSADQYQFTLSDINSYLPTIIRNKTFLLKGTEKFHALDGPSSSCAVELERCVNVPFIADWQDEEEDSTLSELDAGLDQYIATDQEVEQKAANFQTMLSDNSNEKSSRKKKTKTKPDH